MCDSYEQKDNYRSSSDYKNPMGRMSQFKNMFNSMRFKGAAGDIFLHFRGFHTFPKM